MKTKSKGAFRQQKDGTWQIDTKIKVNDVFRHFQKSGYPTLSAAKADYERAKQEFINSKTLNISKVTLFDDLIREYSKMRRIKVNETTLTCDNSIYNKYLLPYFSKKLIKDVIKRDVIVSWYNELIEATKYSNNKKSKVITLMKDLLKFAYQHKYIDAVTYQDCDVELYQVKVDKKPNTERVVWTKEEENAFFTTVKQSSDNDYVMFKVFFSVAARLGEFLALMPKCFDFKNRKIHIDQQIVKIDGKGLVVTDKLKTHESHRVVSISQNTANLLQEYISTLGFDENDFLFHGNTKRIPCSRTTFRRKLYKYCAEANVRQMNPHAVRHLMAVKLSKVADNAEMIEAAASMLGHTPEVFMNTYAKHTNQEKQETLLERMAEA